MFLSQSTDQRALLPGDTISPADGPIKFQCYHMFSDKVRQTSSMLEGILPGMHAFSIRASEFQRYSNPIFLQTRTWKCRRWWCTRSGPCRFCGSQGLSSWSLALPSSSLDCYVMGIWGSDSMDGNCLSCLCFSALK